ncbi:DUF7848 domain-containing protein [Nonomuraea endophytica]|uniref:DUF7848 domain-containing protein n=1 Tax=Nonomuraea endophytica TaxID=714136 RepID=UPI0037C8277B
MTELDLADLPAIAPDEPVVTFARMQCRTCTDTGPWARADDDQGDEYAWQVEHHRATGHASYYKWSLSRQTARVFRF